MTAIDIHSQQEQVIVDITGYYAHNQQPINSLPVIPTCQRLILSQLTPPDVSR